MTKLDLVINTSVYNLLIHEGYTRIRVLATPGPQHGHASWRNPLRVFLDINMTY